MDADGHLWILDHKTAARMRDNLGALEMDEQMGSYNWAFEAQTGRHVAGNIYSEVYKDYPRPPAENTHIRLGRRFSVSKNQATSYDIYRQTLIDEGEDLSLYEEMLDWLEAYGTQYVRRQHVHRSP